MKEAAGCRLESDRGLTYDSLLIMLFYSFFKSLVGKDVVLELKNDLKIAGTLHSVDQYLNFKLTDITVLEAQVCFPVVTCLSIR